MEKKKITESLKRPLNLKKETKTAPTYTLGELQTNNKQVWSSVSETRCEGSRNQNQLTKTSTSTNKQEQNTVAQKKKSGKTENADKTKYKLYKMLQE